MDSLNSKLPDKSVKSFFIDTLKWQMALEYTDVGVWEYDAELDRVFFSKGSIHIIGIDDPSFGTDPQAWNSRVHPDDQVNYFQDFQDHLKGLKPLYENQHRVRCEDGSYKWILDRGKIVEWTPDNQPKRIIGTHTDITRQKEAESKIHEALIIATEHNIRLKNFAHIVTHNLKQHTANFESLMDLYSTANFESEKSEVIGHLKTLSTSLTKTIQNLNEIVYVQANTLKRVEKIHIANEIDHILKMLDFVVVQNNATIYNKVDRKLFIHFNASYFESIVQNLLTNAIKYKHHDRDPEISISCEYDNDTIKLIVSDNGIGIDLEKYGDDIFGLYKTFHKNENAEGVGLYLIKNQIETFGGKITVDSKVNQGTTFTIYAPNQKV